MAGNKAGKPTGVWQYWIPKSDEDFYGEVKKSNWFTNKLNKIGAK